MVLTVKKTIEKIAKKYPYIHINSIINHRNKCSICNFPNSSIVIMFNYNLGEDKEGKTIYEVNKQLVIRVNVHNYIEVGVIEYIKGPTNFWELNMFKKFMDELTENKQQITIIK